MKHLLFALTILLSLQAISQTDSEKECAENEAEANVDFNNGEFTGYHEYIEPEFSTKWEFEFFYQAYMYSKYSIFMETSRDADGCYERKMDSLVRSKFGAEIYKETRKKALKIFENSTRQERSKVLDLSKYYISTESAPKFIGNDYIIQNFLEKHFEYKGKEAAGHDFKYRLITLFINRKGHITNFETRTDLLKEDFNKNDIIKQMNALGDFVPAYLIGVPVNAKLHVDLW
ncbi:hypothetical protein [Kordia sp.]|uniref:hypothetical protein n=1 Tax=Kordia sp. TaxID=1965332 RepID=UPI003D6ABC5D